MNKTLPRALNSYDLLKTFAVIIMIIDHIGFYFYPEDNWWRAIGRVGFPIWFFLAGHSTGRDFSAKLWVCALFLLAMNAVTGLGMMPLNALFTIMILRAVIDSLMRGSAAGQAYLWAVVAVCTILFLPTNNLVEYGTMALMFAMFGYMVRHKGEGIYTKATIQTFMMAISVIFIAYQWVTFMFAPPEFIVMALGTLIVCIILTEFRFIEYPNVTAKLPLPVLWFNQFCGRHTLEIYVVHLTLFKIAALCLGDDRFALFRIKFFIW